MSYSVEERKFENSKWIFVDGYIDEGISGTSVNKREAFKKMIRDAKDKKFNLKYNFVFFFIYITRYSILIILLYFFPLILFFFLPAAVFHILNALCG